MSRRGVRGAVLTLLIAIGLVSTAAGGAHDVRSYIDDALVGLDGGLYAGTPAWEAVKQAELAGLYGAKSERDTHPGLGKLTRIAGGAHSHFASRETVLAGMRPYPLGAAPTPEVTFEGDVAVLTVPGFASADADESAHYLRAAAEAFDHPRSRKSCGWVVDLGGNGGGNMKLMVLAVSPLLDDGRVQVFERREGSRQDVRVSGRLVTWEGRDWGTLPAPTVPGAGPKISGTPVAIVQSSATASGGEAVVLAFTGQAGVATFGTDTAGFTTVNDGFKLSDGAQVTLSYARMGDRLGRFADGQIAPEVDVKGGAAAREAAIHWVAEQCVTGVRPGRSGA